MAFSMEGAKLLYRLSFKNVGIVTIQFRDQFLQRLSELASRVGWSVVSIRDKVVDIHDIVFVRINESQVDRDGVSRTTALTINVASDKKISKWKK